MSSWDSYPSLFPLGHKVLREGGFLDDPVLVQEKIDGSQFSFGRFTCDDHEAPHEIRIRSKGVEMNIDAPEKMFGKAAETVRNIASLLHTGWTYRAEYLQKPKHNTLAYDRVPAGNLVLFDISTGPGDFADHLTVHKEAARLGLEPVPVIYEGRIESSGVFMGMLDRVSVLGGQKVEGVVIKNYSKFGPDKKPLFAKFVSEAFKEIHQGEWKAANPGKKDIVVALVEALRTPARWNKAIQHLKERGMLTETPRDIGALIKEVQSDLGIEVRDEVAAKLLEWAWPQIIRGAIQGLPEWYKEELAKLQFKPDSLDILEAQLTKGESSEEPDQMVEGSTNAA